MSHHVIIYNADGSALGRTSLHHAIRMLVRKVAEPHEWVEGATFGSFPLVTSVMLVAAKYVYPRWMTKPAPWSARSLRERDNHTCAYCGRPGRTVEHIVPRAHGGRSTWENTVVACEPCNARKRDRTPEQAGMSILSGREPWTPTLRDAQRWRTS